MKYAIVNLGCKVNAFEAEAVSEMLSNNGHTRVSFDEQPDATIVFTCAVTNTAAAKSRKILHQAKRIKEDEITALVGCYVQVNDGLLEEADILVGSANKKKLPQYIEQYLKNHKKIRDIASLENVPFDSFTSSVHDSKARCDLKIQDGCNQFCSYCIIPYARGRERSMEPDLVIAESEFGDEADKILDMVSLTDKADHYAAVLSGGEKQRLIIARQLAKQPKVLLLDEPATMACPKTKQEILDAVKKINKELNITVVVVSHLPEIQRYLADRVILLENGEIKKDGNPDEIIDEFLSEMEEPEDIENISTDETVIKVEDIYKRFYLFSGGEVLQIKDINFDVKKENIISLIGPSGAGKTVLLRMLADLELPDKGKVVYELDGDWVDISMPSMQRMDVRRKLGFMYQEFALSYYSTVLSQLATRLGYKNQDVVKQARKKAEKLGLGEELLDSLYALIDLPESEARDLLAKIGLMPDILEDLFPKFPETATKEAVKDIFELLDLPLDILYRKSYELSGGQEVRVMLALILISKPEFLLLDEPFGDLDPITLRIVANSLKKISKEYNITVIMISHNTDFVKEVSNRTLLMEDGKIVDDSEDVDKAVDNFINLCHADYLKENN